MVRRLVKDRLGQAVEILGLLVAVQLGQARHFQVADGFRQFLLLGFFVLLFVGTGFLFVGLGQGNPQGDGVTARLFARADEVAVALAVVDRAEQQIAGRGGAGQRLGLGDVEPRLVAPGQGARAETAPAGQRVVGVGVELERHRLVQFVVEVQRHVLEFFEVVELVVSRVKLQHVIALGQTDRAFAAARTGGDEALGLVVEHPDERLPRFLELILQRERRARRDGGLGAEVEFVGQLGLEDAAVVGEGVASVGERARLEFAWADRFAQRAEAAAWREGFIAKRRCDIHLGHELRRVDVQPATVGHDAVKGDVHRAAGFAEARPVLRDGDLERASAGDGEAADLRVALADGDVLPRAALAERLPRHLLNDLHHDPARTGLFAGAEHHVGPGRPRRHDEEAALDLSRCERESLGPLNRFARVNRLRLEHGDRHAKDGAALRVIGVVADDLGVVHAADQRLRVDLDAEAAPAVHQHHVAGMPDPRGVALKVDAHLKSDLPGVVGVLVKHRRDGDGRGNRLAGVERLAQINATPALRTVGDLEPQVVIHRVPVGLEVGERLVHLQQAPALGEALDVGDFLRGVLDGAADPVRRPLDLLLFQAGQEQRDTAARVGRRHGGAVHLHVALQRPVRDGRDRPAGRAEIDAEISVERRPARRPRVLDGRQRLPQRILCLHHHRRDVGADAEERGGRATGRANCRQRRPVITGAGHKNDVVLVDNLRVKRGEPSVVGILRWATVAHVDQLAVVLQHGDQPAHLAGAHRRAAHAAVADFDRHNLRPWGESVKFRLARVIRRDDAGHVRPMRADIGDDRERVAVVVNVQREVHHGPLAERRPLALGAETGHQLLVGEVAVLVGVHHGAPRLAVVKDNTVVNRAGIVVILLQRLEQVDARLQFAALLFLVAFRGGVGLVEIDKLGLQAGHALALLFVPLFFTLTLEAADQAAGEQLVRRLDADAPFAAGVLPVAAELERAAGETGQRAVLGFALGGSVHIAAAGAVHDIDDLRPPVAGLLQAGRAGIDAGVKDRNRDAATVVSGVFLEMVQRAGLGLGQDALERKRLGAWRRGCGRLRLAKRDDGQAGQD